MPVFWWWMAAAVILSILFLFLLFRALHVNKISAVSIVIIAISGALLVLSILLAGATVGLGRDIGGRYAGSSLKAWFDSLQSRKGPCCSDADGAKVDDPDWDMDKGHYRVRLNGIWIDVPDEAVITEPNRAGVTMVWPMYYFVDGKADMSRPPFQIRCFMPGSMT